MAIELDTARDRLTLFNELEREDRSDSYSVRAVIWYALVGKIEPAQIFVDKWPSFSHVCCLFHSNIYAPGSDRDFVSISSKEEDGSSFAEFFKALMNQRQWRSRQGAVFCYVSTTIAEVLRRLLSPVSDEGRFEWVVPHRHFNTDGPFNIQTVLTVGKPFEKPQKEGWTVGPLREEDAKRVAGIWSHKFPDQELYFRWLIRTFPSACVRDQNGRPVAWHQQMSYGAVGSAYVDTEYRGIQLTSITARSMIIDHLKQAPFKRFFCIRDDNVASLRNNAKSPINSFPSDVQTCWMIYHPSHDGQNGAERSKL